MLATQMPQPSHLPLPLPDTKPSPLPIMASAPSQSSLSHSNMSCALTSNAPSRPTLTRPKLTLQTSSLPISFGSSTTGLSLSLAGGATASPTVRNTFKNAYDVAYPSSATASPSRASRFSKPSSPYTSSNPYQLPLGVKSILRNSLIDSKRRQSTAVQNGTNGSTARRVYFPSKKQVSYRVPLEEEIKTVRFTTRHSDIVSDNETGSCETSSDDDSDYSTSSGLSSETTPSDDDTGKSTSKSTDKKKRKYRSAERQVRAIARMEGLEDPYAATPQTPRQGRLKRRREWKWTLGPIGDATPATEPAPESISQTTPSSEQVLKPLEETTSTPTIKPPKLSLPIPRNNNNDTSQANSNTALSLKPTLSISRPDPAPPQ
ncbi:hypothetical protein BJY04DRAFT_187963 [Aspergillus karnatakaensis]|uniref:uncharacterized protein n=1 Tax=Aspergillus karnatakaensis TaxID=1810916 RepID=UPI003CCE0E0F